MRKSKSQELAIADAEIVEEPIEDQVVNTRVVIARREPLTSFTRVIGASKNKYWRKFSTLGNNALMECPECFQIVWNDHKAIAGHRNWHQWLDEQLGIDEDNELGINHPITPVRG